MSSSYQNEIPKARVNITLEVDSNGASTKKELPMKLLMLGDYSHGKTEGPVAERPRININKNNFNQVMETLSPEVSLTVPNQLQEDGGDIRCDLKFNSINDFSPDEIIKTIPELKKLLAMRHLLKDLKASVLDNQSFRKALEAILKDGDKSQALLNTLKEKTNQPSA